MKKTKPEALWKCPPVHPAAQKLPMMSDALMRLFREPTPTATEDPREASRELEVIANPKEAVRNRFVAACKEARHIGLSDTRIMAMALKTVSNT